MRSWMPCTSFGTERVENERHPQPRREHLQAHLPVLVRAAQAGVDGGWRAAVLAMHEVWEETTVKNASISTTALTERERKDCWKLSVALQNVIERWEDKHPYIAVEGATLCKDG